MKRILIAAVLSVGGLLGVTATASADVGDAVSVTISDNLVGTASSVEVTGTVDCNAANLDYGLIVGVAQGPQGGQPDAGTYNTFYAGDNTGEGPGPSARAEGVGAFGPNFDPPVGVSDDSPCSQAVSGYDVVVQQNRDSGDFLDDGSSSVGAIVGLATSAENGSRGPGPFIGDYLEAFDQTIDFERTR